MEGQPSELYPYPREDQWWFVRGYDYSKTPAERAEDNRQRMMRGEVQS